jgi:putative DNA primase/helicase
MQPIDKVLEALEDYSERGDEIQALCPAHDDIEPSLSIKEADDGRVLLHCHAGCATGDIVEGLGLDMTDLFSKNGRPSKPLAKEDRPAEVRTVDELPGDIEDYFTFEDEEGNLLYIQQHKGPYYRVVGFDEDGDPLLIKGLGDVEPVLFELPNLICAAKAGETVYHLEGCKDTVSAMKRLGVVATTSGGAKTWKSEFAEHYRGAKEVVIVPDEDEEGAIYATKVAQDLLGVAEVVKIVELPGLPEKGDLTDWIDAGHTAEEFFAVVGESEALDPGRAWPAEPTPLDVRLPDVEEFDE